MDKSAIPPEFSNHEQWYRSVISSVKAFSGSPSSQKEDFYHYTYNTVMHGFSAKLNQSELDILEEIPGHVMSLPDPVAQFHTTHSTEFLGLNPTAGLLPTSRFGQDAIVAILDSGIWPESESFNDHGMEPVPARWKGTCENGTAFDPSLCNRKLIGARSFKKGAVAMYGAINSTDDYDSARDFEGHGTHTSSTAGGNYVGNVNSSVTLLVPPEELLRLPEWLCTKSVGRLGQRALTYLLVWRVPLWTELMFSLFLSASIQPHHILGAFAAIKNGVLVLCSAGNDGPSRQSMYNAAPWILTVGASTIDRAYEATLKLGDGSVVSGFSFYYSNITNGRFKIPNAPLFYDFQNSSCKGKLDPERVNGTVLLCTNASSDIIKTSQAAGALAVLRVADRPNYFSYMPYNFFPFVFLSAREASALGKYSSSTKNPLVEIDFGVTVLGIKPAPVLAEFSSRGPSFQSPNILKPDVIATGVNIMAAWLPKSDRGNYYIIDSGTSMSCPHVAGVGALLKAVHSDWSPAAIRSALMTTSYTLDNANNTIIGDIRDRIPGTPLEFGAGHIDPNKAVDPGLVYDIGVEDYINYSCALNYTTQQIQSITGMPVSCPSGLDLGSDSLNCPSFTTVFNKNAAFSSSSTFKRTLTNMVDGTACYRAVVNAPKGLKIGVNPSSLQFTEKFQKQNFTLVVEAEKSTDVVYGFLSWIDNMGHVVKSPVVALFE